MDYRRFFATSIDGEIVILDGEEYKHCVQVTRHKVGFTFIATIGDGYDYTAKITAITKTQVIAKVISKIGNKAEPQKRIILFQAVCKELDFVVQKAVELGATDIYPFYSEYTNVTGVKLDRLKKIVIEAAKQCGRGRIPNIYEPLTYKQAVNISAGILNRVLCYEKCKGNPLTQMIKSQGDVALYIGSEGGFADEEISFAKEKGMVIASLGKRVLRAETAAIAALVIALGATGEL